MDLRVKNRYLVPTDGSFRMRDTATKPPKKTPDEDVLRADLAREIERIAHLQRQLHATDTWAVLLVFQAMDAAGKDGTIRAVMSGVDPSGCQVYSFKQPSLEDLDHDFLWRTSRSLPERGRIGIFNRSYYEEVLVVRTHPVYLNGQKLPQRPEKLETLFEQRYESIRDHEKHLARNGMAIVKFWLNVSRAEQKKRFLARIEDPEANWKFSAADVAERKHWDKYMESYELALRETSTPHAPWYAIPADDKHFMRLEVARTIVLTLEKLSLSFPDVPTAARRRLGVARTALLREPR